MMYARINLEQTSYLLMQDNWRILDPREVDPEPLNKIYHAYCKHKKFKSVMPIFDSEYTDPNSDVIAYFDEGQMVAFSLLHRYDDENVEAVQFAWDYANPTLRLGINSLKSECAYYKKEGFKYLYLGGADEYKQAMEGFEILGPIE